MALHEILIVDPDKVEVQTISRQLKEIGYATLWAPDIDDAFAILRIRPVAAILADYNLPSGTGLDLLARVREDEAFAKLPVLLMTHAASGKIVQTAKEHGVNDFVVKPLDSNRLRKALAQFIASGGPGR